MTSSRRALTCFTIVAVSTVLTYPLYLLQQGNRARATGEAPVIAQLNRALHGRQLRLPPRDYFGARIPNSEVQLELVQPCSACRLGTARYSIAPTHQRALPVVLVFRDESVLKTVRLRANVNVF